ncbi:7TMR-DISM family protein [Marinomonas sp. PE14-40]|uniref:7TMR-DISM family protein n=1 Tax=Marinomonas sp. PE14-40 TaxID=3060621 RepID=UPI003F663429
MIIRLCIVFLLFLSNQAFAQFEVSLLDNRNSRVDIGLVGDYLHDPSGQLNLAQLMNEKYSSQFLPINKSFMQFGLNKGNIWIRAKLAIHLTEQNSLALQVKAPRLQILDIYMPHLSIAFPIAELGELRPYNNRPLNHPHYLVPFPTRNPPITNVYIKLASSTPINAQIDILPLNDIASDFQVESLITGILIGIIVLLMAANILFFSFSRNPMYLFYSMLLAGMIILHLSLHGYLIQLFPNSIGIQIRSYNFAALFSAMALVFFSRYYLDSKNTLPKIDKFLVALGVTNGALALLYSLAPDKFSIFLLSTATVSTVTSLTILSIIASFKHIPYSGYYLAARLLLFIGHSFWILTMYGILASPTFFIWGLMVTVILEGLIHFVAMLLKLNSLNGSRIEKSNFHDSQLFDFVNDLASRMRRQTNIISGAFNEKDKLHTDLSADNQDTALLANRNLENMLERLDNLGQMNGNLKDTSSDFADIDTLIDETLNLFHEIDQDGVLVEINTANTQSYEQIDQGKKIQHLLLTLLLELKHYGDKALTITLKKLDDNRDNLSHLDISISPLPRRFTQLQDHLLNLGLGYVEYLLSSMHGKMSISGDKQQRRLNIHFPARYRIQSRLPDNDLIYACQLFIMGNDSIACQKLLSLLQSWPINIIQIKNISELTSLQPAQADKKIINLVVLFEHDGYIPQLVVRQIKPLLRLEDQCLLVSDNVKMPKDFALTLGFDELIHTLELPQQLKHTITRLTAKGLRLQKATLL